MRLTDGHADQYRADIDGLRAIAVLAVLFFHADLGLPGGYVGVDVFFVISGFLITRLILKDLARESFSLALFWERRIRRILPALALVLFFCLVAGAFVLLPLDYSELGKSTLAQALLGSNFYFWREANYFAPAAELRPLLHTWSLAVEEQFYLLFPLLLFFSRRLAPAARSCLLLALSAGSFGLCVYASYHHPAFNFYLLPTRAWELLFGAVIAALPEHRTPSPLLTEISGVSGLAAILAALLLFDSATPFPGFAALLPCAGVALLIWANGHRQTAVSRLLALKPFVAIGLISYSLYLWHWPLLVLAKYRKLNPLSLPERVVVLLLAAILATLSWRFVETPFRGRAWCASRKSAFSFAAGTSITLLLSGFALQFLEGLPWRLPADVRRYADAANDRPSRRELNVADVEAGRLIAIGVTHDDRPIDFVLWGDSHANASLPIFDLLAREYGLRGMVVSHSAMTPLLGYEDPGGYSLKGEEAVRFKEAALAFILGRQVRHVILVARWDYYLGEDHGPARLRHHLLATLERLRGKSVQVLIPRQVPIQPWEVPRALALTAFRGGDVSQIGIPYADYRRASARQTLLFDALEELFPFVRVPDPTPLFLQDSARLRVEEEGYALYRDTNHLTARGSLILRPLYEPYFACWAAAPGENTPCTPAPSGSR